TNFLKSARVQQKPDVAFYISRTTDSGKKYKPADTPEVPFVCIKIPTGGGKTLVACESVYQIFEHYLCEKDSHGLVVWFVPSDAIKQQTLNKLKDRRDPHREILDSRFDNKVVILDNKETLSIKKSDIENNLCIVISTLQGFRREEKEGLKVYQSNGALLQHFEKLVGDDLDKDEEGNIIKSLANVIRMNKPLMVLDEGHNAKTDLWVKTSALLKPSFVIEFTATPIDSNVLVDVKAFELKSEQMVKIPINLENHQQWQEALKVSAEKQRELEKLCRKEEKETGEFISPIVLIQAEQIKESVDKVHAQRIIDFLTGELKISRDEIAKKTGDEDEIGDTRNLFLKKNRIKYIITRDAIKEGWDCSFAYILVSVSNIGTRLAVEQLMGRILRLPYAKNKKNTELNESYVITSSKRFDDAAASVIKGLEDNGYSKDDIRIKDQADGKPPILVKRKAIDEAVKIPFVCIKDKSGDVHELDFWQDLVGEDFDITRFSIKDTVIDDYENRMVKIDIDKTGQFIRERQEKLPYAYQHKDETKEELFSWLLKKVQNQAIDVKAMKIFLQKSVDKLVKKNSLAVLFSRKFTLRDALAEEINRIIDEEAEKKFNTITDCPKSPPKDTF
ncbi:MAG: DEAD/DEAH box helicase family protein, partial [Planctomycetota bacterium]|nr:DEAD/DEAH box helicase family protein [Planctomycetota bacterium]